MIEISLAQWSLHRSFLGSGRQAVIDGCLHNPYFGIDLRRNFSAYQQGLDPLDFPLIARQEFGIDAVEYVNTFFFDRVHDNAYFSELNRRAEGEGVRNVLLMCDFEGPLGAADSKVRAEVVRRHIDWLMIAALLDCRAIRVNAHGEGSPQQQRDCIADSLYELAEQAAKLDMDVLVENHGQCSADANWLHELLVSVGHPRLGALVDFGNWAGDPYDSVERLLPFARGVSAKSYAFDQAGRETRLDYRRLISLVKAANYQGYIGVEYEGEQLPEYEGVRLTKALLEKML